MENENTPLTPMELVEWVNEHFDKDFSKSWSFSFQNRHKDKLIITDALPLEVARTELSVEILEKYGEDVYFKIIQYLWHQIFNWDECGVGILKTTSRSCIVSKRDVDTKRYYKTVRPPGHITILPVVSLTDEKIPPLLIVSQKTMDDDLKKFGFPNSNIGWIISTESGFITEDALLYYIENCVGPEILKIRTKLGCPDERSLFLQDGMSAHLSQKVKDKLAQFGIDTFEIPPHSSHLTQVLDQGTFAAFKNETKKKYKNSKNLSTRSNNILHILRSMERCTGSIQNISAFENSGFVFDRTKEVPLEFNINKILEKDRAPQHDINAIIEIDDYTPKKREKLKIFESKKSKNQKKRKNIQESENVKRKKKK